MPVVQSVSGFSELEGEASSGGELETDLGVEPRHRGGRIESPVIEGDIGVSFLAPWAKRDVEGGCRCSNASSPHASQ